MGGIEKASSNVANELCRRGHEIHLISIFQHAPFFEVVPEVKVLYPPNNLNKAHLSSVGTVTWLRRTLRALKPDRVLVYGKFYGAMTALAMLGDKTPLYLSERSSPFLRWPTKIRLFNQIAFFLRSPQGIISQTKLAEEMQRSFYRSDVPFQVIPNSVDPKFAKVVANGEREPFILAVGRLNDHLKGFDLLLRALARCTTGWPLHIAGGTEDGHKLTQLAEELGIRERVIFLGKVRNIESLLAKAGLFVIPSRSEGFPNALAEAMVAGVPSIAFDFHTGPRDLIEHNVNGLIVPDGDVEAMAEAIDRLVRDPDKRAKLGNSARELYTRVSPEHTIALLEDFIV